MTQKSIRRTADEGPSGCNSRRKPAHPSAKDGAAQQMENGLVFGHSAKGTRHRVSRKAGRRGPAIAKSADKRKSGVRRGMTESSLQPPAQCRDLAASRLWPPAAEAAQKGFLHKRWQRSATESLYNNLLDSARFRSPGRGRNRGEQRAKSKRGA